MALKRMVRDEALLLAKELLLRLHAEAKRVRKCLKSTKLKGKQVKKYFTLHFRCLTSMMTDPLEQFEAGGRLRLIRPLLPAVSAWTDLHRLTNAGRIVERLARIDDVMAHLKEAEASAASFFVANAELRPLFGRMRRAKKLSRFERRFLRIKRKATDGMRAVVDCHMAVGEALDLLRELL